MSNEVNNLASSFVAMAQAFEKLPIVQSQLDQANTMIENYAKHIQSLELRLIDRANELDAAHAATRKMEVERDHAETMFLETDDKLSKAKDVLKILAGNAGDFLRVVEPPQPEPVIEQPPVNEIYAPESTPVQGQSAQDPTVQSEPMSQNTASFETVASQENALQGQPVSQPETVEAVSPTDPTVAPSWATPTSPSIAAETSAVSGESVASSNTEGVSVRQDPTPATGSSSGSDLSGLTENAVQLDRLPTKPYEGKRYTDVPFYVSLVEWLNGGGTEEAYYAR